MSAQAGACQTPKYIAKHAKELLYCRTVTISCRRRQSRKFQHEFSLFFLCHFGRILRSFAYYLLTGPTGAVYCNRSFRGNRCQTICRRVQCTATSCHGTTPLQRTCSSLRCRQQQSRYFLRPTSHQSKLGHLLKSRLCRCWNGVRLSTT